MRRRIRIAVATLAFLLIASCTSGPPGGPYQNSGEWEVISDDALSAEVAYQVIVLRYKKTGDCFVVTGQASGTAITQVPKSMCDPG